MPGYGTGHFFNWVLPGLKSKAGKKHVKLCGHLGMPGALEEMVVVTMLECWSLRGMETKLELHHIRSPGLEPHTVVQFLATVKVLEPNNARLSHHCVRA